MNKAEQLFFMRPELIGPLKTAIDNIGNNPKVPDDMRPLMQETLRQMLTYSSLAGWALLRQIDETSESASVDGIVDLGNALAHFKGSTVFIERCFLTIAHMLYSKEQVLELHGILTQEAVNIERVLRAAISDPADKLVNQPKTSTVLQ